MECYLKRFENQLLIIDEVQRKPDLFRTLRSMVDIRKRAGETAGQFLLLGSASRDLLQHSAEADQIPGQAWSATLVHHIYGESRGSLPGGEY